MHASLKWAELKIGMQAIRTRMDISRLDREKKVQIRHCSYLHIPCTSSPCAYTDNLSNACLLP